MHWLKRAVTAFALLVAVGLMVLATPRFLFAYQIVHGPFHVWSDRPIDARSSERVLDDALARLAKSDLYTPDQRFQIFICNDSWKLALYSQRFNGRIGGVADGWLTQNVYLRQANFETNQIVPPGSWMYDRSDRPLSYYIAHETTHILEARAFGRFSSLYYPVWLTEGYADYVGKGGQFDLADNLRLLRSGDPLLDPTASGLYRRYHLAVAYELEHRRSTARDMFAARAPEARVLADLQHDSTFVPAGRR